MFFQQEQWNSICSHSSGRISSSPNCPKTTQIPKPAIPPASSGFKKTTNFSLQRWPSLLNMWLVSPPIVPNYQPYRTRTCATFFFLDIFGHQVLIPNTSAYWLEFLLDKTVSSSTSVLCVFSAVCSIISKFPTWQPSPPPSCPTILPGKHCISPLGHSLSK